MNAIVSAPVVALAFLAVFAVIAAGCTATPGIPATPVPSPTPLACGFTSCHGLDLSCGYNPPQVCTALYQLGDKCRQLAYCNATGGSCTFVSTPEFEACKRCVNQCGGADSTEIFLCEEKC